MVGYEPVARLGRGGMGVVDLARDQDGNQVALKRLTLHGSASEVLRSRQRLLREAEVLRRLHHPNVVRLLDVVEEGDDVVLVMPYLSGGNLSERVAQHGPAPPDEIDKLAQRLLGALAEAHALGIIHRDVKPANVLYDDHAEPYLADFGLAHTWDQTHGLTVAGMVVGTPGFMPPEQARDEPLTPASDIFAVGATLLFAATGGGPFGSGDPGLLMVRAASGKVEKVPKTLPKPLRARLTSMLDPKPERRPTAGDLLEGYAVGRAGAWRRGAGAAAPTPRVAVAVGLGCVAVVAGAFVVSGSGDGDDGLSEGVGGGAVETPADEGPDGGTSPTSPGPTVSDGDPADEPGSNAETPLLDRLDAMVDRVTPADVYPLPIEAGGAGPTYCPGIDITLTITGPSEVPLRVAVLVGGELWADNVATSETPAVLSLGPDGTLCDPKTPLSVVVEAVAPLDEPIPYLLERRDVT
jgi:hypothetical protein